MRWIVFFFSFSSLSLPILLVLLLFLSLAPASLPPTPCVLSGYFYHNLPSWKEKKTGEPTKIYFTLFSHNFNVKLVFGQKKKTRKNCNDIEWKTKLKKPRRRKRKRCRNANCLGKYFFYSIASWPRKGQKMSTGKTSICIINENALKSGRDSCKVKKEERKRRHCRH